MRTESTLPYQAHPRRRKPATTVPSPTREATILPAVINRLARPTRHTTGAADHNEDADRHRKQPSRPTGLAGRL
jgi:hypothetical protein